MSLGTRLRNEREKRNWSQMTVAKKVGITNAVLSNYERDHRDPDTETLKRLAELYEVTTDYLLGHNLAYNSGDGQFEYYKSKIYEYIKFKVAQKEK